MAQIGTIRLETQNSGTVDVPVFDTGDSASGVYEFVRVQTASGTGFIPVTSKNDAAYPYLRVQSQNNGIVAVTDTAGDDIPDSDNLHVNYDLQQQPESDGDKIDTLIDQSGNGYDANSISAPTMDTSGFNDYPAAILDGSNDGFEISDDDFDDIEKPTIYAVMKPAADEDQTVFSSPRGHQINGSLRVRARLDSSDGWRMDSNDSPEIFTTGDQTTYEQITARFDPDDAVLRAEGSEIGSETFPEGDADMFDLSIGFNDDVQWFEGPFCQILVYDALHDNNTMKDVEDFLDDRWGGGWG